MKNIKLSYDIKADSKVPYYMWDYLLTNKEIRNILSSSNNNKKIWLIAKIMRDAKFTDIWQLINLKDILKYKAEFKYKLGNRKKIWDFLFEKYKKYGIAK